MKSGKSRLQRVQVLASGKYKFVKNLTKRKSSPKKGKTSTKKKKTSSKKGGNKHMGRRKGVWREVKRLTTYGSLLAPALGTAARKDISGAAKVGAISGMYFGYNTERNEFVPRELIKGYAPYVLTKVIHKGIALLNRLF